MKNQTPLKRAWRALRSSAFLLVYGFYLVFFFGLVGRFVVWPLTLLFPKRRVDLVGVWFRILADSTLWLARVIGDVQLDRRGSVPEGSCIVIMNHQSLLDIPIAYSTVKRPYPVIPTRRYYSRGIPGVSLLLRMAGHPFMDQTKESRRQDVKAIMRAMDEVEAGRLSMLIFPEGHRTMQGEIDPFMTGGLRTILARANRPIYAIVVDGLWASRTTFDAMFGIAGLRGAMRVLGPFAPPTTDRVEAFTNDVRAAMIRELSEIRGG